MADPALNIPRISAQEYLAIERQSNCKHEFVNGIVYAMAGASRRHNTISLNIRGLLADGVSPPCQPFALDVKLSLSTAATERFYYPDVLVTCSDLDNDANLVSQPTLIVEVLSDSTEGYDRGEKFAAYRLLPSLQEYVLVQQDIASVELYRRRTNWQKELYGSGDVIEFESVGLKLSVADFYRRITFEPAQR